MLCYTSQTTNVVVAVCVVVHLECLILFGYCYLPEVVFNCSLFFMEFLLAGFCNRKGTDHRALL